MIAIASVLAGGRVGAGRVAWPDAEPAPLPSPSSHVPPGVATREDSEAPAYAAAWSQRRGALQAGTAEVLPGLLVEFWNSTSVDADGFARSHLDILPMLSSPWGMLVRESMIAQPRRVSVEEALARLHDRAELERWTEEQRVEVERELVREWAALDD